MSYATNHPPAWAARFLANICVVALATLLLPIALARSEEPSVLAETTGPAETTEQAEANEAVEELLLDWPEDWIQPPEPIAELEAPPADPLALELPAEDPIRSSREMLELRGVEESHLRFLMDGRPLHGDEHETLHRILYNLPRMNLARLEGWLQRDVSLRQVAADPAAYRTGIFRIVGRARSVKSRSLSPEQQNLFEFAEYYEIELEPYEEEHTVCVYVRRIPAAWQPYLDSEQTFDEQASVLGMFLKTGGESEGSAELLFTAPRIAWHPDRVDESLGVDGDHVLLASLGMDIGLFDDVVDGAPMQAEDGECFYQLLSSMRNANLDRVAPQTVSLHEFGPWLEQPETQHGRLITVRGICRQAIEVLIDDPDIQSRFGISHYYQLVVFAPLEDTVNLRVGKEEEEVSINEYQIVVCVRQLPEGMPSGPDINEVVQVTGVYFKLYAYKSERFSQSDGRLQLSPLLVGLKPRWIREKEAGNSWIGPLLGGLFVVTLLGVWLVLWRYNRGDREFSARGAFQAIRDVRGAIAR